MAAILILAFILVDYQKSSELDIKTWRKLAETCSVNPEYLPNLDSAKQSKCELLPELKYKLPLQIWNEENRIPPFANLTKLAEKEENLDRFFFLLTKINSIDCGYINYLPQFDHDKLLPPKTKEYFKQHLSKEKIEKECHEFPIDPLAKIPSAHFPKEKFKIATIAIDAGHLGEEYSQYESRHFIQNEIVLKEGDLTQRVVDELKLMLKKEKINFFETRNVSDIENVENEILEQEMVLNTMDSLESNEEFSSLVTDVKLINSIKDYAFRKFFFFNLLKKRSELANSKADLLISIHFNGGFKGEQFHLSMIPGHVPAKRLYNAYWRYQVLRDSLQWKKFFHSYQLAEEITLQMNKYMPTKNLSKPYYPDHISIFNHKGEYWGVNAWNGIIFRYLDIPAVLVEGPHYDDPNMTETFWNDLKKPLGDRETIYYKYALSVYEALKKFI